MPCRIVPGAEFIPGDPQLCCTIRLQAGPHRGSGPAVACPPHYHAAPPACPAIASSLRRLPRDILDITSLTIFSHPGDHRVPAEHTLKAVNTYSATHLLPYPPPARQYAPFSQACPGTRAARRPCVGLRARGPPPTGDHVWQPGPAYT